MRASFTFLFALMLVAACQLLQTDRSSLMRLAATGEFSADTLPRHGSLTQSGMIFGTPLYMAPEYVAGVKEIGPPADIFSFGIIAYELLAGRRPFRELPITAAVHGRPLTPETPLDGVRPDLVRLLLACLSADPAARPTARDLVVALRAHERTDEQERVG